jgi:hypothetical protein|tara:strand:+ start:9599 stop:12694 length:3096 start_codon:yes stop_codon:yes gene_type:complete
MAYEQYVKKHKIQTSRVVPDQANREIAQGWKDAAKLTDQLSNNILQDMASTSKKEANIAGQQAFQHGVDENGVPFFKRTPVPEGAGSIYMDTFLEAQDKTILLNLKQSIAAESLRLSTELQDDPNAIENFTNRFNAYTTSIVRTADDKRIEGQLTSSAILQGRVGLNTVTQQRATAAKTKVINTATATLKNDIAGLSKLRDTGNLFKDNGEQTDESKEFFANAQTAIQNLKARNVKQEITDDFETDLEAIQRTGIIYSKLGEKKDDPATLMEMAAEISQTEDKTISSVAREKVISSIRSRAQTVHNNRVARIRGEETETTLLSNQFDKLKANFLTINKTLPTIEETKAMLEKVGITPYGNPKTVQFYNARMTAAIGRTTTATNEDKRKFAADFALKIAKNEQNYILTGNHQAFEENMEALAETTDNPKLLKSIVTARTKIHTKNFKAIADNKKLSDKDIVNNIGFALRTGQFSIDNVFQFIETNKNAKPTLFGGKRRRLLLDNLSKLESAYRAHLNDGNTPLAIGLHKISYNMSLDPNEVDAVFKERTKNLKPNTEEYNNRLIQFSTTTGKLPSEVQDMFDNIENITDAAEAQPLIALWKKLPNSAKNNLSRSNLYNRMQTYAKQYPGDMNSESFAKYFERAKENANVSKEEIAANTARIEPVIAEINNMDSANFGKMFVRKFEDAGVGQTTSMFDEVSTSIAQQAAADPTMPPATSNVFLANTDDMSRAGGLLSKHNFAGFLNKKVHEIGDVIPGLQIFDTSAPYLIKGSKAHRQIMNNMRLLANNTNITRYKDAEQFKDALLTGAIDMFIDQGGGATFYGDKRRVKKQWEYNILPVAGNLDRQQFDPKDQFERSLDHTMGTDTIERYINDTFRIKGYNVTARSVLITALVSGELKVPEPEKNLVNPVDYISSFWVNTMKDKYHADPIRLHDNGNIRIEYVPGTRGTPKGEGFRIWLEHSNAEQGDFRVPLYKGKYSETWYPSEFIKQTFVDPALQEKDLMAFRERNETAEEIRERPIPFNVLGQQPEVP